MNILIIAAHPNPNGFTHKIAETYKTTSEKLGHTVKILDLYNQQYTQDYLRMNETNRPLDEPKRDEMHKQITRANEMVFIFPIRWFDCPAILKNRFDQNFSHGFAFKYRSWKLTPAKLLKGKTARVFATAWAPNRVFWTIGAITLKLSFRLFRLDYVWISLKNFTVFGNMNKLRLPKQRAHMLKETEAIANRNKKK